MKEGIRRWSVHRPVVLDAGTVRRVNRCVGGREIEKDGYKNDGGLGYNVDINGPRQGSSA
jgi:hypothetical protein